MDAAGSKRAAVFGISEGGPMSALLAATHPDRVSSLILYGSYARMVQAPDYPEGITQEALSAFIDRMTAGWGGPAGLSLFAPTMAENPEVRTWWARLLRMGTSPSGAAALIDLYRELDVRAVLPTVLTPCLVLHRTHDRIAPLSWGRALARLIPEAKFIELPGPDHAFLVDADQVLDEVVEFLTGTRSEREPDRMLATVMFTDIVDSTRRAAELGDRGWREVVERHDQLVRRELDRHRGREIKTMGDGFLATFDGPARAIRCATEARDSVRKLGIEMRAGLHTGEVEVMNGDVGGIAVSIGARVGAAAGPGEVLVSRTVTDLVAGSGIDFTDRGPHALKGVPGEWQLYAVTDS